MAWKRLRSADYSTSTRKIQKNETSGLVTRVLTIGTYDFLSIGQLEEFSAIKNQFSNVYLIVGIIPTAMSEDFMVMNNYERNTTVKACKHVDEILSISPVMIHGQFLEELKIDYLAVSEAEYTNSHYDEIRDMHKLIKIPALQSDFILKKIVSNRDVLVNQYLDQGYKRHELGTGLLDEISVKSKAKVKVMMRNWNYFLDLISTEVHEINIAKHRNTLMKLFKKKSYKFCCNFVLKFEEKSEIFEEKLKKFYDFNLN